MIVGGGLKEIGDGARQTLAAGVLLERSIFIWELAHK